MVLFGWILGASLGLVASYGLFVLLDGKHTGPITFATFAVGALLGSFATERLPAKALRWVGMAAGLALTAAVVLLLMMVMRAR